MPDIIPPPFATADTIYTRTGLCNRCGLCCWEVTQGGTVLCPHLTKKSNKWFCKIYATRADECESCKVLLGKVGMSYTHAQCEDFPQHPFLDCLKTGLCGYHFMPEPVVLP